MGDTLIDPKALERIRYLRSLPAIVRIWLITNGILLDKFGIDEVLNSGLTSIMISTAGFDEAMYRRVYRSTTCHRMRRNVTELVEKNSKRRHPLPITIALRPDRPLADALKDPDFQPILAHHPQLDFTWAFGSIGGKVALPSQMARRVVRSKPEACVQTYNGLMVLADGTVMGCGCVAAMDAQPDLVIGHVMKDTLLDIWRGEQVRKLRKSFCDGSLNKTCTSCDIYRDLDLFRTFEGRTRARLNRRRSSGNVVRRATTPSTPFAGG